MKRRNILVGAALLTAAVLTSSASTAMAAGGGDAARADTVALTTTVPAAIQVPPGQVLIADMLGRGVQFYQCTAGAWAFVEPAANLVGWAKRPTNLATAV